MKILHVTPVYPPHVGGTEGYVYNLVKHERILGNDVRVITSHLSDNNRSEAGVFRLPVLYNFKGDWGEMPICPTIFSALKHINCDVIHGHICSRFFVESVPINRLFRKKKTPFVLTYHYYAGGSNRTMKTLTYLHDLTFMRMLLRTADTIIAITESNKQILSNVFGVDSNKIVVIPPGIEMELFSPERFSPQSVKKKYQIFDENIIMNIGRLAEGKGVNYLIEALQTIHEEIPDAALVIVGDGPYRTKLQKLAHEKKLDPFVRFIGQIEAEDVPEIISIADVVVLPSVAEMFGVVLIEALSMAKPVIATRLEGICETICRDPRKGSAKCETGILFEKGNIGQLANAITELLSDKKMATRMGTRGRELVKEKYDWNIITPKILQIYEKTLKV